MTKFPALIQRIAPIIARLSNSIHLSPKITNSLVMELKSQLGFVNESYFQPNIILPSASDAKYMLYETMYHCSLLETEHYNTSIFGFRDAGVEIPLHNHPEMFGFIKVLKGRICISSYSFLDPVEESHNLSLCSNLMNCNPNIRLVRFEGLVELSGTDSDVVHLGPMLNNIHVVKALEDGAAFFDLLVPGYKNCDCSYYVREEKNIVDNVDLAFNVDCNATKEPEVGSICYLRQIDEPANYRMQTLDKFVYND